MAWLRILSPSCLPPFLVSLPTPASRNEAVPFVLAQQQQQQGLRACVPAGLEQGMVTRPPELHAFASWQGFLAATTAAEDAMIAATTPEEEPSTASASASAAAAPEGAPEAASAAAEEEEIFSHYLLPPLRLAAHPPAEFTLPSLLVSDLVSAAVASAAVVSPFVASAAACCSGSSYPSWP